MLRGDVGSVGALGLDFTDGLVGLCLEVLGLFALGGETGIGDGFLVPALLAVGADPFVVRRGFVDLLELLLRRASFVGSLDGGIGSNIPSEDARILQKLCITKLGSKPE